MQARWPIVVMLTLFVCAAVGSADMFAQTIWEDDFEDGDYTSNPTWPTYGSPGATHAVQTYEGDYAFHLTAPYVGAYTTGWSGAYVDEVEGDQGITGWLDTSPTAADDWGAVYSLRYSPGTYMGTGYAAVVRQIASGQIWVHLVQLDDGTTADITDAYQLSSSYTDVWVRFQATGTDASTRLLARVWADGAAEPTTWTLDSNNPGSEAGITNYYNTGRGGVGMATLTEGVTADAYFDDVRFSTPEPGSIALVLAGLGVLGAWRRRRS